MNKTKIEMQVNNFFKTLAIIFSFIFVFLLIGSIKPVLKLGKSKSDDFFTSYKMLFQSVFANINPETSYSLNFSQFMNFYVHEMESLNTSAAIAGASLGLIFKFIVDIMFIAALGYSIYLFIKSVMKKEYKSTSFITTVVQFGLTILFAILFVTFTFKPKRTRNEYSEYLITMTIFALISIVLCSFIYTWNNIKLKKSLPENNKNEFQKINETV